MKEKFEFYALKLAGVCILVYILTAIFPFLLPNLALVSSKVWIRPWTIITHIFLHKDLLHLGYNLFALALFGSILEKHTSSRCFLLIFFGAGIASSIGDILFYHAAIGASGAIFGVLGSLAVLRPKMIVWVLGVPMYVIIACVIWAALDLAGMFYSDNIAHAAHLFGLGFGISFSLKLRKIYKESTPPKKPEKYEISDKELDEWEDKWMFYSMMTFLTN